MVEELRRSEEQFRTLAEASLSGIFIFQDGTFRYANPALGRIFGYDAKQMIRGMKPLEVTHPEDREASEDYIRQCLDSRERDSPVFSFRGVQSNGNVIDCEVLAGVVDYKGKPALIGTILEVTARKQREEELARTQKIESLGVLAGGIAHDFNNILTAISTNISMARMYGNLEDDISQMITDAEKASLRAKKLTQQLLAFAKGGKPIKKTVSIVPFLRDTAEFALSGSNVKSEYFIPEDIWYVVVDEGQISQVINNLVINAGQAMPAGGTINISAENVLVEERDQVPLEKGKYVRISVTDQGTGISQKHLNKIFDPFFTTKQKGSGLGLATSFTLVKNNGGHIAVHSELDIGTTVDVYLPASEEAAETGEREKVGPIKGEGRVLLIDDDEMIRRSTGEMLKRFGYDMKLAKDGEEGLKFYKKARESGPPFDAVIMDLTIRGGMGGKETIQELMKIDPDAKVIVSSGYSDDPVMSEFGAHGFVGLIEKPYRIKELGALLGKVIGEERP
jgi:PAS domain S-box-containing protein